MSIEIPPDTTFESAQAALDERVARLESGAVGLDEAVRIFEEAMAYMRFCEARLAEIRGRIEELTAGDLPPAPASPGADPDDEEPPF